MAPEEINTLAQQAVASNRYISLIKKEFETITKNGFLILEIDPKIDENYESWRLSDPQFEDALEYFQALGFTLDIYRLAPTMPIRSVRITLPHSSLREARL